MLIRMQYRHKHLHKFHVWGGISKQGATQLVMFSGIMNATKYGDILSASLVPFIAERLPKTHRPIRTMIPNTPANKSCRMS